MKHVKKDCKFCPPLARNTDQRSAPRDWEAHPSWILGMEALNNYGDWVSSVVLPVAFQWIEEHKAEVYATVPNDLKDDVGVVLAAAFRLIKELPAYQEGLEKSVAYEEAIASGTWDPSRTNPEWTSIVKKVRSEARVVFAGRELSAGDN